MAERLSRDTFSKLFIPGYGPVVDIFRSRSFNPLNWSEATWDGLSLQAGVASLITLSSCAPAPTEVPRERVLLNESLQHLQTSSYYKELGSFRECIDALGSGEIQAEIAASGEPFMIVFYDGSAQTRFVVNSNAVNGNLAGVISEVAHECAHYTQAQGFRDQVDSERRYNELYFQDEVGVKIRELEARWVDHKIFDEFKALGNGEHFPVFAETYYKLVLGGKNWKSEEWLAIVAPHLGWSQSDVENVQARLQQYPQIFR